MNNDIKVPLQYICAVVSDVSYYDKDSRKVVEEVAKKNIPENCRVYKTYWTEFLGEGLWQLTVVYYEVSND